MKLFKLILPVVAFAASTLAFAVMPEDRQMDAIQDFLNAKKEVNVRDKSVDLTLSGDVRVIYQSVTEKEDGVKLRGSGAAWVGGEPVGNNLFEGQLNLHTGYRNDNVWATSWLEFYGDLGQMGTGDGEAGNVTLREATIGYRVMEEGTSVLDVWGGRVDGYHAFNSKVMFNSNLDGLFGKYKVSFEDMGDFYVQAAIVIANQVVDQYAWIVEAGLLDVADTGAFVRYSYSDWEKKGTSAVNDGGVMTVAQNQSEWKYRVSHLSVGYDFDPEMLGMDAQIFGAVGINHAATRSAATNNKKKNRLWYLGGTVGKLEKAGDWAVEVSYQSVAKQAVADFDVSGIGRGDISGLTENNYKGWHVQSGVNITDNLQLGVSYASARSADKEIDGKHTFNRMQGQVIFAF